MTRREALTHGFLPIRAQATLPLHRQRARTVYSSDRQYRVYPGVYRVGVYQVVYTQGTTRVVYTRVYLSLLHHTGIPLPPAPHGYTTVVTPVPPWVYHRCYTCTTLGIQRCPPLTSGYTTVSSSHPRVYHRCYTSQTPGLSHRCYTSQTPGLYTRFTVGCLLPTPASLLDALFRHPFHWWVYTSVFGRFPVGRLLEEASSR